MKRISRVFTVVHILPWTVYAGAIGWDILVCGNTLIPNIYLAVFLTALYVFYAHFFILSTYANKKKYEAYFIRLLPIVLTAPLPFLFFINMNEAPYQQEGISMILATITAFLILSFLARMAQNIIINAVMKEEFKKQAISSELVYLKSQINPHFLFNTLNNIHTLVYTQAASAPEAVMRLSSLMRYMIYESNAATVPLAVEIKYLQDFIGLQQLRYEAPDIVDFKVEGNVENCNIAPLLFIHLLENTYKHSPAKLETGAIKVRIVVKGNGLTFGFQNPVANKIDNLLEEPGGIGLANVQKRLQLLYPDQHQLEISNTKGVYKVELTIHIQPQKDERKTQLLYH
jgi:sensor histidine kinase YesM